MIPKVMSILNLPTEIRLKIWSACFEIKPELEPQSDQICKTIHQFCGHEYNIFNHGVLPLLLTNRQFYREISTLLHKERIERGLSFCSPGCVEHIICHMSHAQLEMVGVVTVHAHGRLEVPIEAVHSVGLNIMRLLKETENGRNGSEVGSGRGGRNWTSSLQYRNTKDWALVFECKL